jgi:hypothetical protein
MKRSWLAPALALVLLSAATGAQADLDTFWEDLKLRLSPFKKLFTDQSQELGDIRQQGIDPEQYTRIDLELLRDGGPSKDGIPSIDRPQFDTAKTTPFGADALVVAVEINGDARAYPYGIMNWHEVVNDTVGGVPVTVSYCPLCDTMLVHGRGDTTFGVSGKLFESCLVMYDRTDETLYAQPWAIGIIGPQVNRTLRRYPVVKTTLGQWLAVHPDSKVLSTYTGHARDYFAYPYGSYMTNRTIIFPVRHQHQLDLHPKAIVSYLWQPSESDHPRNAFAGPSTAVTHERVRRAGELEVPYGDRKVVARWAPQLETVIFYDQEGTRLVSSTAFAFVYPAFFGKPLPKHTGSS